MKDVVNQKLAVGDKVAYLKQKKIRDGIPHTIGVGTIDRMTPKRVIVKDFVTEELSIPRDPSIAIVKL